MGEAFLVGQSLTVSGWGTTSSGGSSSSVLLSVDVPCITNAACEEAYRSYGYSSPTVMLCAGNLESGGVDSCQGDSGGKILTNW